MHLIYHIIYEYVRYERLASLMRKSPVIKTEETTSSESIVQLKELLTIRYRTLVYSFLIAVKNLSPMLCLQSETYFFLQAYVCDNWCNYLHIMDFFSYFIVQWLALFHFSLFPFILFNLISFYFTPYQIILNLFISFYFNYCYFLFYII